MSLRIVSQVKTVHNELRRNPSSIGTKVFVASANVHWIGFIPVKRFTSVLSYYISCTEWLVVVLLLSNPVLFINSRIKQLTDSLNLAVRPLPGAYLLHFNFAQFYGLLILTISSILQVSSLLFLLDIIARATFWLFNYVYRQVIVFKNFASGV